MKRSLRNEIKFAIAFGTLRHMEIRINNNVRDFIRDRFHQAITVVDEPSRQALIIVYESILDEPYFPR